MEETKLRLRAMDLLRAQNSQRVSMRSPTGTPHDRGVGNVLAEEGGEVWAMVGEFALVSGLGTSLLSVRPTARAHPS